MTRKRAMLNVAMLGALLPPLLVYLGWTYHKRTAAHRAAISTIAFIPQITADDIWEPAHFGAIAALRGSNDQIYWNGPNALDDVATQIQLLQQAVNNHVRGIIVAPIYGSALMVPVEQALRQGAHVVIVGEALPFPTSATLHYVLTDEKTAGRLLAERLVKVLSGRGRAGVVGVDPASTSSFKRLQSFQASILSAAPGLEIVARRQGANSQLEAEQRTRELLQAEPHLQAIVALTPEATAGAYAAMEELTKKKRPILLGAGQEYSSLYRLSDGQIDSLLVENTFQIGYDSARILRSGSTVPSGPTLLAPVLVTRENMLEPALTPVLTHLSGAGL